MCKRLRKPADERGFTLVEILVVVLIIGILAALSIPAFFDQSVKAYDASAKEALHTARTAIGLIEKEEGTYEGVSVDDLRAEEPTLTEAMLSEPVTTKDTYTLEATSSAGTTFSVSLDEAGTLNFDCAPRSMGGCPADGNWSS